MKKVEESINELSATSKVMKKRYLENKIELQRKGNLLEKRNRFLYPIFISRMKELIREEHQRGKK